MAGVAFEHLDATFAAAYAFKLEPPPLSFPPRAAVTPPGTVLEGVGITSSSTEQSLLPLQPTGVWTTVTVKSVADVAVGLPLVVIATFPAPVVPEATTAVSEVPVPVITLVAAIPLIVTVAPAQRFVPLTAIVVPTGPVAGENDAIVGVPEHVCGGTTTPTQAAGTVMSVPLAVTVTESGNCVQTVPLTRIVCA